MKQSAQSIIDFLQDETDRQHPSAPPVADGAWRSEPWICKRYGEAECSSGK
jgi:hypothetical protein